MLELESRRGGEGRLVIQRQRDCERVRETEQEREGRERGDNVNSSAPSTVS